MKPLAEARAEVLKAMPGMATETIPVERCAGRVTAEPVVSAVLVPPFDNSAMDGFAVRAADVANVPTDLRIIEDVPAGSVPTMPVGDGEATRIMTGAPMPAGADTIVKVEDTNSTERDVTILEGAAVGTSVRKAGGDVMIGDTVVGSGIRLTERHVATLASVGASPLVAQLPTVAVMSTGDEVQDSSLLDLSPGQIRDTNKPMLVSLLTALGVPTVDLGIIGDDKESLRAAYSEASLSADLVVSTGGVSMGDYDFVKEVLGEAGTIEFWQVAMQPAKPFAFGSFGGVPLLGLPGNPVSTFVAYEQFVRPAVLHMMGAKHVLRPRIAGVIGEDVSTNPEKEVFLRVMLADDGGSLVAVRSGGQDSNILSALADAQALAVVPVGVGSLSAGDSVTLEMFTWPENRSVDE